MNPEDAAVRARLPRVFGPFFRRFPALSAVQRVAIPAIAAGRDVLLAAPTGTGKTEAYLAPLVEALLDAPSAPLRLLLVSPTRALANDLYRRVGGPLAELGLPVGRRTGEHKDLDAGRPPDIAVTTPEALDALLARRPGSLRGVRAVAVDEIHVLDGTPRGDQLRLLLHRLDAVAEAPVQRVAASATVAAPAALAARHLRDAVIVDVGGGRPIRARAFVGLQPPDLVAHLDTIAAAGGRKVLVFARSRSTVEQIATALRDRTRFADRIFPHHASLSRRRRELTERRFLEAPAAVAVATMTLELGIDIGTVDYVLLAGPPSSVGALLQQGGRGGRRGAKDTALGYAFADPVERALFRVMLRRAGRGDLCADATDFRPGVLIQQALVLAGGEGHVTRERLAAVVPPALAAEWPPTLIDDVLAGAVAAGLLEAPLSGRHVLGPSAERRWHRGEVHGNIGDEGGTEVFDRLTGDLLGTSERPERAEDGPLKLGGRARRVALVTSDRVLTDAVGGEAPARFRPRPAPPLGFALARAWAEARGAALDALLQWPEGGATRVLHGLGAHGGALLADCIRAARPDDRPDPVFEVDAMTLGLSRPLDGVPPATDDHARRFVAAHEKSLARSLGMGPYHRHLPTPLRREAVLRASPLRAVCAYLATARVVTLEQPAPLGD